MKNRQVNNKPRHTLNVSDRWTWRCRMILLLSVLFSNTQFATGQYFLRSAPQLATTASSSKRQSLRNFFSPVEPEKKAASATSLIEFPWKLMPSSSSSIFQTKKNSRMFQLRQWATKNRRYLIHCFLFVLTGYDTIFETFANEHDGPKRIYSYFTRLQPRLLVSIGAVLRALQMCTPLQSILDPSIGVGVGLNICANFGKSYWIKFVILGWAMSEQVWEFLGARSVKGLQVPISVSVTTSRPSK